MNKNKKYFWLSKDENEKRDNSILLNMSELHDDYLFWTHEPELNPSELDRPRFTCEVTAYGDGGKTIKFCPGKPTRIIYRNNEQVVLCEQCYENHMNGAYEAPAAEGREG